MSLSTAFTVGKIAAGIVAADLSLLVQISFILLLIRYYYSFTFCSFLQFISSFLDRLVRDDDTIRDTIEICISRLLSESSIAIIDEDGCTS